MVGLCKRMIILFVVDKLQLVGSDNRRYPIVNAQFTIYLTRVEFDGSNGDSKCVCDCAIRLPNTNQFEDFYFSWR